MDYPGALLLLHRQLDYKLRVFSFTIESQSTVMGLNDANADRQAKPRTLTNFFGSKEIEQQARPELTKSLESPNIVPIC